jgi:hypothetical protein
MAFAVVFIGTSFPITDASFIRVDETHFVSLPPPPPPPPLSPDFSIELVGMIVGMHVCLTRFFVQVLDVWSTVSPEYQKLKEVSLFLTSPAALPDPNFALGLYVSLGGQEWQFRGYISADHPSEVRMSMLTVMQETQVSNFSETINSRRHQPSKLWARVGSTKITRRKLGPVCLISLGDGIGAGGR